MNKEKLIKNIEKIKNEQVKKYYSCLNKNIEQVKTTKFKTEQV